MNYLKERTSTFVCMFLKVRNSSCILMKNIFNKGEMTASIVQVEEDLATVQVIAVI